MKKCELHNVKLENGFAPIRYGLLFIPDDYIKARKKLFPNANTFVAGGCIVGFRERTELEFCTLCREAEENWKIENKAANK